jgi:L-ascorbate metabolism protein UlaG (beta-lactamase superfamily)
MFAAHSILRPSQISFQESEILSRWISAHFERRACKEALYHVIKEYGLAPELFSPDAIDDGGMVATDALLFGIHARPGDWRWWFSGTPGAKEFSCDVTEEGVSDAAEVLRTAAGVASVRELGESVDLDDLPAPMREAFRAAYQQTSPHGMWQRISAPGIYRREHASLVIRSATTSVVTDPQGLAKAWTTFDGCYPADREPLAPDAIAVTHSHGDHWSLASVLGIAGSADTPVLVPRVPERNLLCHEDLSLSLKTAGQRVLVPEWGATLTVGDIEIEVLPFYGEQPTREAPGCDPRLRNWGNCYRFDCPDFSALVLVDSGVDPSGSALEVVAGSVARRGPLDVVLSCCGRFPEGINLGLPRYALALPFSRLEEIFRESAAGRAKSMTLGPEGVAEACRVARARYFLPYAHGFSGLGRDPLSAEGPGRESDVVSRVVEGLAARGGTTQVLSWLPGDAALASSRALKVVSATP